MSDRPVEAETDWGLDPVVSSWSNVQPGAGRGLPRGDLLVVPVSSAIVVLGLLLVMVFGMLLWGIPVYFQHERIQLLEERSALQRELLQSREQMCSASVQAVSKCETLLRGVQARLGVVTGVGGSTPP